MLRLLMIVSGAFEALFGLSALAAPDMLIASLGTEPNAASIFLARILGAATLGLKQRSGSAKLKRGSPRGECSGV
jgi:hypothetical protein